MNHIRKIVTMAAIIIALAIAAFSKKASALELQECTDLSQKFHDAPYKMTVRELDDLRICVDDQIQMVVQQKRSEQMQKAIERNFGSK